VDNIEKKRDYNPSFEAVYILHPNRYNIEVLISDFDPANRHYAAAHIFFISSLDNKTFEKISSSPIRPMIRSLVEMNLDFNPIENMVFSTNTPETFQVLYNPSCRSLVDSELSLLSKKVNLFATVLIVACVGMCVTGRKSYYPILQTTGQSTSRKIPRRTISPTPSSRPRRPRRQQQ